MPRIRYTGSVEGFFDCLFLLRLRTQTGANGTPVHRGLTSIRDEPRNEPYDDPAFLFLASLLSPLTPPLSTISPLLSNLSRLSFPLSLRGPYVLL